MAARRKVVEELEEVVEELDEIIDELEEDDEKPEGESFSAKEAAAKLNVDARTFRKFLRAKFGKIGQGNRWLIEADKFDELKAEFEAWHKPKTVEAEVPPADDEIEELDDELEDLDELTEA